MKYWRVETFDYSADTLASESLLYYRGTDDAFQNFVGSFVEPCSDGKVWVNNSPIYGVEVYEISALEFLAQQNLAIRFRIALKTFDDITPEYEAFIMGRERIAEIKTAKEDGYYYVANGWVSWSSLDEPAIFVAN
jgi:hypothetical protein